jgi:membrane protein DedA with SNARE-associated domain
VALLLIGAGTLAGLICALLLFSYRGLAILSGLSLILSTALLLFAQRTILATVLCCMATLVGQQTAYLLGIRWQSHIGDESDS